MRVDFVYVIPFRYVGKDIEILLMRRSPSDGLGNNFWQSVSGTNDKEEEWSPEIALREVEEETGLSPKALYEVDILHWIWLRRQDIILKGPVFAAEMSLGEVVLSEEHTEYRWLSPAAALELLPRRDQRNITTAFLEDRKSPDYDARWLLWNNKRGWVKTQPPKGDIDRTY